MNDARLSDLFWAKVRVDTETGCWRWKAGLDGDGYALFWHEKRTRRAHRVAYEALVGPIPEGLQLDHVKARGCLYRDCVNPDHLEPVTCRVNQLRGDTPAARLAARTHCDHGHEFTPENTGWQLPDCRTCLTCRRAACRAYYAAHKREMNAARTARARRQRA